MKVVKHALGTWFIRDVRHGQASSHGVRYRQASLVVNVIGRPVCPSDVLCRTDVVGEPCIGWASGASLVLDGRQRRALHWMGIWASLAIALPTGTAILVFTASTA